MEIFNRPQFDPQGCYLKVQTVFQMKISQINPLVSKKMGLKIPMIGDSNPFSTFNLTLICTCNTGPPVVPGDGLVYPGFSLGISK